MAKKLTIRLNNIRSQLHLLSWEQQSDSMRTLEQLFEAYAVEDYHNELCSWFTACSDQSLIWNGRYPGDLVYTFGLINKLLELSWLMHNKNLVSGKFPPADIDGKGSLAPFMSRKTACHSLLPDEQQNPYLVLGEFYYHFFLHESQVRLLDWLIIALSNSSLQEHDFGVEYHFYQMTHKLIDALHEINIKKLNPDNIKGPLQ